MTNMIDPHSDPSVGREPHIFDHKETCNRIFQFFADQRTALNNWGFYLFDEQFNGEPELRNKLGSIWVSSLYDTLDGELRLLPSLNASAKAHGCPILVHYCDQIQELATATRTFLSGFSRSEQLFLQDFRNQLVHSWQINTRQEKVSIKYVRENEYFREQIINDAYHDEIRPYYENGIDKSLSLMLDAIWRKENKFSLLMISMAAVPDFVERIRRDIYSTLTEPKSKFITGPILMAGGTQLAMWDRVDLEALHRDALSKRTDSK